MQTLSDAAASDMGLHSLLNPVCRSLKGKYGIFNYRTSVGNLAKVLTIIGSSPDKKAVRANTKCEAPDQFAQPRVESNSSLLVLYLLQYCVREQRTSRSECADLTELSLFADGKASVLSAAVPLTQLDLTHDITISSKFFQKEKGFFHDDEVFNLF